MIFICLFIFLNMEHDVFLRVLTRSISYVSMLNFTSYLFSLVWSILFLGIIRILSNKAGKLLFIFLETIMYIYTVSQYVYWCIFSDFFRFSDILVAKEGADYIDVAFQYIDKWVILYTLLILVMSCLLIKKWDYLKSKRENSFKNMILVSVCSVLVLTMPITLGKKIKVEDGVAWDMVKNKRYVYETLVVPGYAYQTVGEVQYIFKDLCLTVKDLLHSSSDEETIMNEKQQVQKYLIGRENKKNEMTGYLKDKNLVLVQMESIDDWLIDETYTPTIYQMMKEGINFTNFYTPSFGTGYTVNTEFAVNTGLYPYVKSKIPFGIPLKVNYENSMANIFNNADYISNSFHDNTPSFYSRGVLHKDWAFDKYNHTSEFSMLDSNLIKDKNIQNKFTTNNKFFNF